MLQIFLNAFFGLKLSRNIEEAKLCQKNFFFWGGAYPMTENKTFALEFIQICINIASGKHEVYGIRLWFIHVCM